MIMTVYAEVGFLYYVVKEAVCPLPFSAGLAESRCLWNSRAAPEGNLEPEQCPMKVCWLQD